MLDYNTNDNNNISTYIERPLSFDVVHFYFHSRRSAWSREKI